MPRRLIGLAMILGLALGPGCAARNLNILAEDVQFRGRRYPFQNAQNQVFEAFVAAADRLDYRLDGVDSGRAILLGRKPASLMSRGVRFFLYVQPLEAKAAAAYVIAERVSERDLFELPDITERLLVNTARTVLQEQERRSGPVAFHDGSRPAR